MPHVSNLRIEDLHMQANSSANTNQAPPSPPGLATPSPSQPHFTTKRSNGRRTHGRHKRSDPPPPQHDSWTIQQLLLALCSATLARLKLYAHHVHGLLTGPILRLPGVALSLMRALWRCLLSSRLGQTGMAICAGLASIRCSFSYSLIRSSRQTLEAGRAKPGMAANVGYAVSLLWGSLRLKSQVELRLARPDFAAAFQRSLQRQQRRQIELEQQHRHYQPHQLHQQQLRSSAHNAPACDTHGLPQRLMLPDQAWPGGDVTVMCSQEMTATILSFLRQQQAGVQDGTFWAESPRTVQSEDGSNSRSLESKEGLAWRHGETGGVSITFCSSPATRVSHPLPCKRLSCSSISPETKHHQIATSPVSTPAAGLGHQQRHGTGASTSGPDNPVWHNNPCCVTTPALPEEASPGSAVSASLPADATASLMLPLETAEPGSEDQANASWLPPQLGGASPVKQQQQQQQEMVMSRTQQQLYNLEGLFPQPPLQGPLPGGASPVRQRQQSRGQRSRMWDLQSSCGSSTRSKGHKEKEASCEKECSSSTPCGVAGHRKAASASVEGLGACGSGASARDSGTGQEWDHALSSVATSMEGGEMGGPECKPDIASRSAGSKAGRWARLDSSSGSGAEWSSSSFGASKGGEACVGVSAALRFAQRLALETGATDGHAPPPAFLLPHAPPRAPESSLAKRAAKAPLATSAESFVSANQASSLSGQLLDVPNDKGSGSSRSSVGSAAGPQVRAARKLWGDGAAEGDEATSSSSSSSGRRSECEGSTVGSASAREDNSRGRGCSRAGSTSCTHNKPGASAAAAAAAAATAASAHPRASECKGGARAAAHAHKGSGDGCGWWAAAREERNISSSGRSGSGWMGSQRVPMPVPACGGASALEQCLHSGTGVTLRTGAAETAAASAVVRAARRSSSNTPRQSAQSSTDDPPARAPAPTPFSQPALRPPMTSSQSHTAQTPDDLQQITPYHHGAPDDLQITPYHHDAPDDLQQVNSHHPVQTPNHLQQVTPHHSSTSLRRQLAALREPSTSTAPHQGLHPPACNAANPQEPLSSSSMSTSSSADVTADLQMPTQTSSSAAIPSATNGAAAALNKNVGEHSSINRRLPTPSLSLPMPPSKGGHTVAAPGTQQSSQQQQPQQQQQQQPEHQQQQQQQQQQQPPPLWQQQQQQLQQLGDYETAAADSKDGSAVPLTPSKASATAAAAAPAAAADSKGGSAVPSSPSKAPATAAAAAAAAAADSKGGSAVPSSPSQPSAAGGKGTPMSSADGGEAELGSPAKGYKPLHPESPADKGREGPASPAKGSKPRGLDSGSQDLGSPAAWSLNSPWLRKRTVPSTCPSTCPPDSKEGDAKDVSGSYRTVGSLPTASTKAISGSGRTVRSPTTSTEGVSSSNRTVGSPATSAEGVSSCRRTVGSPAAMSPARLPPPTDLPLSFWGLGQVFDAGL